MYVCVLTCLTVDAFNWGYFVYYVVWRYAH